MLRLLMLFPALLSMLALNKDGGGKPADDGAKGKTDDGKPDDDDTDDPDDDPDDTGKDDEPDDGDGDGDNGGDEKKFSQAELDAEVNKRLAREKSKHERALKRAKRGKAKPDDGDGDDDAKATAASAAAAAKTAERLVSAEVRAAAAAAGVPADKVKRFARLVDTDPADLVDGDGDVDEDAIADLVDETLDEWPEFKPSTDKGRAGSSGADTHDGDGKRRKKAWTRTEIAQLSDEEFEKHKDEIQAQVSKGLVK